MFAEDEAALLIQEARDAEELARMVEGRVAGLPVEQVVGWAEFCGLRIALDPGVFVPRHRTELLAREAARLASPGAIVVDLCCGSGAVGAAVATIAGRIELHAVDIDAVAVRCARRNLAEGEVYQGDLYQPLPDQLRGRVDVVVANVPYVPSGAIEGLPREARLYEPRATLDGGPDGLDVVRRVAAGAPLWLAPGGCLLVEVSDEQSVPAEHVFAEHGLTPRMAHSSELEATVVVGIRP